MTPTIAPAGAADLAPVLELLRRSKLPEAGFADHLAAALVARDGDRVVGSAALELYGSAALLRSVAVDERHRSQGLGRRLAEATLDLARARGVDRVYLLTDTAPRFFARLGFSETDRATADPAVRKSVEFRTACPASAICMMLHLSGVGQPANP